MKGQPKRLESVAVGAPGGGVEGLLRRLADAAGDVGEKAEDVSSPWERERLSAAAQAIRDAGRALEQQEARAEQYRLDAERYQQARRSNGVLSTFLTPEEYDAAIDAAIKQEQPHE